jgi:RecA-family ATPase
MSTKSNALASGQLAKGANQSRQAQYNTAGQKTNSRTFNPETAFLIPEDLKSRPQWILWRYVLRPGESKPDKVPTTQTGQNLTGYTEGNGHMAFQEAVKAYQSNRQAAGIGFVVMPSDGLIGVDMDNCLNPETGEMADWASQHVEALSTYTEISPSGTGVRMFVRGELPPNHIKKQGSREIYTQGRFLTITGRAIGEECPKLPERREAVSQYIQAMEAERGNSPQPETDNTPAKSGDILDGNRDVTLTSLAGTLRREGFKENEIEAALHEINRTRCKPPLDAAQVSKIARSVARYDAANDFTEVAEHDSPFDLQAAKVADLLATDPPPRRWLVSDRVPLGIVGLLAAAGGTGKSMAVLQLAVSVCTGLEWLEMPLGEAGAVLMFSAEDDREELHRRLKSVVDMYADTLDPFDSAAFDPYKAAIAERLHVFDRVGMDNRLTARLNGELHRTAFARRVIEVAEQVPDCKLIVLDPLARFDGGEPNDNADSTRLIECAEEIRKATGATVLLPHHVSKASMKDNASGQEAVRGGSGLVDGSRWVGLLSTMRADTAEKEYGIDPEEAAKLVRFTTPKANYSAPWEGVWLRRISGGALVPTIVEKADSKPERKSEERYASFLVIAKDLIRKKEKEGEYLNVTKLRGYGGQEGIFSMGVGSVKTCIARALEEGELFKRDDGTLRLF